MDGLMTLGQACKHRHDHIMAAIADSPQGTRDEVSRLVKGISE